MRRRSLATALALACAAGVLVERGAAWAAGAGSGHDPQQVRDAAQHVLDRPQYQEPAANRIKDAIDWVLDHLFPESLRSSVGGGPGFLSNLVVIALLAGVALLVYRVVRGWRPRVKAELPEAELTVEIEERRSAREWAALADRLVAEGRYREAVRARYGELVARLADDGSVATSAGRTSGELRADVGLTRPAGAAAFDAASTLFEQVWYGGGDAAQPDVDRVRTLGSDVLRSPKAELEPAGAGR